jgi:hypothetical protein
MMGIALALPILRLHYAQFSRIACRTRQRKRFAIAVLTTSAVAAPN